jgi:4-amino-4-deoxychorismate lyase
MYWLDGSAQADGEGARPDRGLEFGDGVFETVAVVEGRPRLLEAHLARLARGCARLQIEAPAAEGVRAELERAGRTPGAGVLKLIVTRGAGGGGYAAAAGAAPHRHLYALPARPRPPGLARDGVAVRICTTRLAEQPLLAGIKHLNRLEQVCARAEWSDPEIAEGLMLDVHGRLVCGTMSNVFMVLGGELVTPLVTRAGVEGVMRAALGAEFRAAGASVAERDLTPADLDAASEVFLTNALIGAWPVIACGERRWSPGPWLRRAQAWVAGW